MVSGSSILPLCLIDTKLGLSRCIHLEHDWKLAVNVLGIL